MGTWCVTALKKTEWRRGAGSAHCNAAAHHTLKAELL